MTNEHDDNESFDEYNDDEERDYRKANRSYLEEPIYDSIHENLSCQNESWNKYTNLFYSIQILCLASLVLSTLGLIGLTLWLNFNSKYQVIHKLANEIDYTSVNKLVIGYLNYTFIFLSILSLSLDLVQIYLFRKTRIFLNSYHSGFEKVNVKLSNSNYLETESFNKRRVPFELRKKFITRRFRQKTRSFKLLVEFTSTFYNLVYIIFVVSLKFMIGIWFERYINEIVNNQIPVTMWKLFKEFEALIVNRAQIGSKEFRLVNYIQLKFECCHYLNPYQYNTYEILNCNLRTACLKPVQYFFINAYYYILLFLLLSSSINLLFLIFQFFNFKLILIKKILYSYKSQI